MLPPKSDPRWAKFVDNLASIQVTDLSARMFLSRLKMRAGAGNSEAIKRELIAAAYDFFSKHETTMADDIRHIFAEHAGGASR
jgi:hypothetical protein